MAMYVNNSIIEKFAKIKNAFSGQPICRLISENDKGEYLISNVSTARESFSGGFYDKYCVERMELKFNDEACHNK